MTELGVHIYNVDNVLNGVLNTNLRITDGLTPSSVNLATETMTFVDSANLNFITNENDEITANVIDGSITTAKLAANSVTTAKVLDANVTTAKIADSSVTTAKLAANSVTTDKISNGTITESKLSRTLILTGDTSITLTSSQAGGDVIINVNLTANRNITLPTTGLSAGMSYKFVRTDTAAFTSTIDAGTGSTIEGFSSATGVAPAWIAAKQTFIAPNSSRGTLEVVYVSANRWIVKGTGLGYV